MNLITKLKEALSYIPVNKGITLAKDTFLIGLLDGTEISYGFYNQEGKLYCITSNTAFGFPIEDIDKDDLNYIFNTDIYYNIKEQKYAIKEKFEI